MAKPFAFHVYPFLFHNFVSFVDRVAEHTSIMKNLFYCKALKGVIPNYEVNIYTLVSRDNLFFQIQSEVGRVFSVLTPIGVRCEGWNF